MRQRVVHDVQPHAQRLFSFFRRIVVNVLVFETVSEIRVVRIEYNQPSVVNNAVRLRRTTIVLVNLRQSTGEFVKTVRVGGGFGKRRAAVPESGTTP